MLQSHSQVDLDTRRTSHRDLAPGSSNHNTSVVLCSVLECSAVRVGLSTELQTFMESQGTSDHHMSTVRGRSKVKMYILAASKRCHIRIT